MAPVADGPTSRRGIESAEAGLRPPLQRELGCPGSPGIRTSAGGVPDRLIRPPSYQAARERFVPECHVSVGERLSRVEIVRAGRSGSGPELQEGTMPSRVSR